MAKTILIFFSRDGENYVGGEIIDLEKGNSRILAEYIQAAADCDVFEVVPAEAYPEDYMECTQVAQKELNEKARPELKETLTSLEGYDTVILLGPCWWGSYPMPLFTQIEKLDFAGKKVLPVMSHEGSGMGNTVKDLKRACPGAKILRGLPVKGSATKGAAREVADYLKRNL